MQLNNIIFRVDTNKDTGLGHIKRCQALATKFQQNGYGITFVGVIDRSFEQSFNTFRPEIQYIKGKTGSREDCAQFLAVCEEVQPSIVVIDNYLIDDSYCERIISAGYFVVSVNDTGMKAQNTDMIINTNLNAETVHYDVPDETILLLGIKYLMMPEEYWDLTGNKRDSSEVKDILITMGSADEFDLTTRILNILNEAQEDFTITVIIGPYFDNNESIADQIKKMKKNVRLIRSPISLFPYIKECSIAVSSAGQTLYQCAALGCPMIGISVEENQRGHLRELSQRNALIGLKYDEEGVFDQQFKDSIFSLIKDSSQKARLSETAFKLCDGRGVQRAFEEIVKAYNGKEMSSIQG